MLSLSLLVFISCLLNSLWLCALGSHHSSLRVFASEYRIWYSPTCWFVLCSQ